MKNANLYLS